MNLTESKKQSIKVLLSTVTGNLGSAIFSFIIGLLILNATESALSFGISQVIGPVVALFLLPFTGSIIDKYNKKTVAICAQLLSVFGLSGFAILITFFDSDNLIFIYILLIFLKISDQFLSTTFTASIIHIVDKKNVQKLKSYQQILNSLMLVFAPIIGAVLFNFTTLIYLVILEIVIECVTLLIILTINFQQFSHTVISENDNNSMVSMFKDGLRFIQQKKQLVFALFFSMLINFIFGAVNVGLPFIQIQVLQLSNNVYGITEAIFSFGMIISGIVLSISKEIRYPLFSSWRMIGLTGLLLILLGISLVFPLDRIYYILLIAIFNFLMGICMTMANVPVTIWMTKEVPQDYQGRVFNILSTGAQLFSPIGILLFSGLFDLYDSFIIFILAGLSVVVVTLGYPLVFKVRLKENKLSE